MEHVDATLSFRQLQPFPYICSGQSVRCLAAERPAWRRAARPLMANCEVFALKPVLELEAHQIREVLRLLLHSIIFQRALGPVKPVERDSELFDVTWVRASGGWALASGAAKDGALANAAERRSPVCTVSQGLRVLLFPPGSLCVR